MPAPSPHRRTRAVADRGAFTDLAALGLAVLFVGLATVYLPLGLTAVIAQDGISDEMRSGLGRDAPLPLRAFTALVARTPYVLALALVLVLLHVGLRRLVRRDLACGASLRWDVFTSPLLLFLAGSALVAGVVTQFLAMPLADTLTVVALSAAGLFLLLSLGGLLAHTWLRWRGFRWLAIGLLLALALARVGADAWGHARLAAYDALWQKQVAAERERRAAVERPVLRGVALEEDAAPRYRTVFEALHARGLDAWLAAPRALARAAAQEPFAAIPADVRRAVAENAHELDAVRLALRCRRCTLGLDFDTPSQASQRQPALTRTLASMLVVEGHMRAQAGDLRGATERYLDAVRFAGDASAGPLVNALISLVEEQVALQSLGRLVLGGQLDRQALAGIEGERARLEAVRASMADGVRGDRLLLGRMENTMARSPAEAGLREPRLLGWLVPYRALAADAVYTADALQRDFESALIAADAAQLARADELSQTRAGGSWNPMRRNLMGYASPRLGAVGPRLLDDARRGLAWFRLAEAALRLEGVRLARGRYPQNGAAVRLPDDPFTPGSALRFAAAPAGLRIWSVGPNGRDDGGEDRQQQDIVLTPAAPAKAPR